MGLAVVHKFSALSSMVGIMSGGRFATQHSGPPHEVYKNLELTGQKCPIPDKQFAKHVSGVFGSGLSFVGLP